MGQADLSTDEIVGLLVSRLEDVVASLYPSAVFIAGVAYCSYKSPKEMGSFQVFLRSSGRNQRGSWVRWSESLHGGVIQLVAYARTGRHTGVQPYAEAFRWAKEDFLRLRPTTETEEQRQARRRRDDEDRIANQARRAAQDAEDKAKASRRRLQAGGQWQDAGEIWGAPAEAYLLGRGLPADLIRRVCTPDVMRFSRSVHYDRPPFSDHPCLLGKVSGIDGKGVALGRVFLTEDGRKADLADPKLTIGRMEGGAVRLGGLARRIGVAEGMETALGAMALCGGSMPVWACLGTSGLSSWEPPPGIDEVVIYADGDWERERGGRIITPGKDAAEALARRLRSVGMPVEIAMPPRGKDWLDLWNEMKGMIDDAA